MKKTFLYILTAILLTGIISSCYSSRKTGCPMNVQSNARFRG